MGLSAEANQRLSACATTGEKLGKVFAPKSEVDNTHSYQDILHEREAVAGIAERYNLSPLVAKVANQLRSLPADQKAALVGQLKQVLKDWA